MSKWTLSGRPLYSYLLAVSGALARAGREHAPVKHLDRVLGVGVVRKGHGAVAARAAVGAEDDVGAHDGAGLSEEILEVLPTYAVG